MLLREWFLHPNGALPAYEWNFDDVNPPVHVMAALRVFRIDGGRDREFLERIFQKLLVNFTWWLNREDADGNNVFSGGFLGLDNISPIDRSNLPEGVTLEQADGTAWMAYYALSMLVIAIELAEENDVYHDMVIKFLEQFVLIARALERQGLYDPEDGFFYDRLVFPSGESSQVKVQTISGLIPLLPAVGLPADAADAASRLGKRFARLRESWTETGGSMVGRVRAARRPADGARLGDRPGRPPADARGVLRRGGVPLAARPALGLEALRRQPVHARRRARRDDRLRAGRVDHQHVRRQLELARPGLDPGQLPGDPPVRASTSASSATTSSSSTRPARASSARSARSRRTWPTGSSRSGCRAPTGAARLRRHRAAPDGSGLEGQPPLLRVLPRRQRRRPRRDAPDRLDGPRRRPDPRPARVELRPRANPSRQYRPPAAASIDRADLHLVRRATYTGDH